jgi:sugar lactone lactonase YvrE
MNRREAIEVIVATLIPARAALDAAGKTVSTLLGSGQAGYSEQQVNNPYGLLFGPDQALYFCDLDNQRIRRLDLRTRKTTTIAGNGQRAYSGNGGPAVDAALNMPHEIQFDSRGNLYIAERDNHVVRRVDAKTGIVSTLAGTNTAGFSGDGGPAASAQLRQPHSIAITPSGDLLICDIGNHRIRHVNLSTGIISTFAGTGERQPTPDGASLKGTPLNGPRTIAFDRDGGLYLALREGNAIYRIDQKKQTIHHIAGTGEQGYAGDGGPAKMAKLGGPKGLAYWNNQLFVADTENHVVRHRSQERHDLYGARHGRARRWTGARSVGLQAVTPSRSLRRSIRRAVCRRQRGASDTRRQVGGFSEDAEDGYFTTHMGGGRCAFRLHPPCADRNRPGNPTAGHTAPVRIRIGWGEHVFVYCLRRHAEPARRSPHPARSPHGG